MEKQKRKILVEEYRVYKQTEIKNNSVTENLFIHSFSLFAKKKISFYIPLLQNILHVFFVYSKIYLLELLVNQWMNQQSVCTLQFKLQGKTT